ncbi:MarR family winged helix-turn-helix transcriptional regulator [Jeotgalibacillus salarius]|uniref:MarR family transcriptional regulator n=1 Tax=Jeotgalibacillus salarius TaxID=546023 RepID=A0A4Y8LJB0_9BACL|nr:MarR family transcriptional regulator [Jeotgalibacillus salarius]TFE00661.1 MarR family transcriptional regulator [Jeotgalibacillus salarius]
MNKRFKEAEKFRYLILAVQRHGNKLLKDLLKEIGITPSQSEVISVLKNNENITLKQLGYLLICEEGSPSRLIDRMVKEQLIERIKDSADSRFVRLKLTKLGQEKYSSILEIENGVYQQLENIYTNTELQKTNELLDRFISDTSLSEALNKRGFSC